MLSMVNQYTSRPFVIVYLCFFLFVLQAKEVVAEPKRHLVLYGGISDNDIPSIARNYGILILGDVRIDQLKKIRQLNPKITMFKYHHPIGMHKVYTSWYFVSQNEDWYLHDKVTGERLVEKKHGWYLMNMANENWRSYFCERINNKTDEIFDGVFIDNAWETFQNKFVCEHTEVSGILDDSITKAWAEHMKLFFEELRWTFKGLIFINGCNETYINLIDGCMEESFIHSTWNSDVFFHDISNFERNLLKIAKMSKHRKTLLLHSGTMGDLSNSVKHLFRYCYASYLLVSNQYTSFSFQPSKIRKGVPYFAEYDLDIGKPEGEYFVFQHGSPNLNLAPNGDFNDGLLYWQIKSGSPSPDAEISRCNESIRFLSQGENPDRISSQLIPVMGDRKYKISVCCKAENVRSGRKGYYKLGLKGRFYDESKKRLPGAYDLKFKSGTYDWLPFEITYTSPSDAAYFKITELGFIGDGTGKGWVDNVYFSVASKTEKVFRRNFSKGIVLVNCGEKTAEISLKGYVAQNGSSVSNIKVHEGIILIKSPNVVD